MRINGIQSAQQIPPANSQNLNSVQTAVKSKPTQINDQLTLSPEALIASRVQDLPEIRADKVADIRAQIESGKYETPEKLDVALDRLLDELA